MIECHHLKPLLEQKPERGLPVKQHHPELMLSMVLKCLCSQG